MNDIFENLHPEKKKKILDACIEEFGHNGYDNASTNSIVKNAHISKGTLFNYFKSKKNLFLYIFDYCMEYLMSQFDTVKDRQPSDLFDRLVWLSVIKVKMYFEHPMMSRLVVSAVANMPAELKDELAFRYGSLKEKYTAPLLEGIDTSKFREGVDPKKSIELVSIFLDGLSSKYLKTYKNKSADEIFDTLDIITKECYEYLEILKYGIYKEQGDKLI